MRFVLFLFLLSCAHGVDYPYESYSTKSLYTDIKDQDGLTDCNAVAIADSVSAQLYKHNNITKRYSALFLYWNARNLTSPYYTKINKGTFLIFNFDAISRYGLPDESYWEYKSENYKIRPPWLAYKDAIQNKFYNYYQLEERGEDLAKVIIDELKKYNSIIVGFTSTNEFINCNSSEIIQYTNNLSNQNHAVIVVGWNGEKQYFQIKNSWTSAWCDNGYGNIGLNYITSHLIRGAWVIY